MAHVQRDIQSLRSQAAKLAQMAADARKSGDKKKAKHFDSQAKALIDTANEIRVLSQRRANQAL